MITNGSVEESVLHVRINQLERRLAQLEKQVAQATEVKRDGLPKPSDEADEGFEGARLVAIELLSSGYAREEVAGYLSSTFGVADPQAVITGTGLVPG